MRTRLFYIRRIERGDGHVRAVVIECASCRQEDYLSLSGEHMLPPEVIAKKFRAKGWRVGSSAIGDVCDPCCTAHKKEKSMKARISSTSAAAPLRQPASGSVAGPSGVNTCDEVLSPSDEPPRQMGIEDRRIIFAKLNDVYLDQTQGYSADWSDRRVAADLGVPRIWVEAIRDENFGTGKSNEEIAELMDLAAPIRAELAGLLQRIREDSAKAQAAAAKVAGFEARLQKIEKAVR